MRDDFNKLVAAYGKASPLVKSQIGHVVIPLLALVEKIISRLEEIENK